METKPRILYLKKILEDRTDEEHPLSTTQLINILNDEYGISAHRTTVTKDIAALQEFGMDIVTIHSTQSKYFVASRKFELPELKLLIDAVESSKFITITYFVPDDKKSGGAYLTHSGIVKKIDEFERKLIMQDETVIPTEQISVIQGEMFKGLYE